MNSPLWRRLFSSPRGCSKLKRVPFRSRSHRLHFSRLNLGRRRKKKPERQCIHTPRKCIKSTALIHCTVLYYSIWGLRKSPVQYSYYHNFLWSRMACPQQLKQSTTRLASQLDQLCSTVNTFIIERSFSKAMLCTALRAQQLL